MENFSLVIEKIYEASHHPDGWNEVMEMLCADVTGARSAVIYMQDERDGVCKELGRFSVQGDRTEFAGQAQCVALTECRETGFIENEAGLFFRYRVPLALGSNDNAPGRGAVDNLYGKPAGGDLNTGQSVSVLIHGISSAVQFTSSAHSALELLGSHIERAVRLFDERYGLRLRQTALQSALSKLVLGLIIIGPDNQLIFQNSMAELMLSQHKGLRIKGGRLRAYFRADQERLTGMLARIAGNESLSARSANHLALTVRHPQRSAPIAVMLAPLADGLIGGEGHRRCVALYLSCSDGAFDTSTDSVTGEAYEARTSVTSTKCAAMRDRKCATTDVLNALYQLSPAEAAIAISLSNGLTVTEISRRHNVTSDTVRTQLKSVFTKMGVNKQQDVIRVLLGGVLSVQQGDISSSARYAF